MNADTFIKARLATIAILEAGPGGSPANISAIAFVLRNRVDAGWQGGDWMRVMDSMAGSTGNPRNAFYIDLQEASVKVFLQEVDDIFDGSATDELTNGALFYCELHRDPRKDFVENVVRKPESHPRVATIGLTAFFG